MTAMATARVALHRVAPVWTRCSHPQGILIAVGSLFYAIVLALNILTLLAPPSMALVLGAPTRGEVRIAWVMPGSTLWERGVRWGDRVLALDGRTPARREAGLWIGGRAVVRGATGRVTNVSAAALRGGHDPAPLLPLGIWFFLLGTLVALRARQPRVGRAAYAFLVGAAYAFALAPAADADEPLATVAEFAAVLLFAAFFVRFFLIFPRPRGRRVRCAVLLAPLVVIALGLARLAWPALSDVAARLRLVVVLAYLLLGAGLLAHACIKERERDLRRGLIVMSVGTAVSVLPFALLYLVPTLLHRPALASSEHAALAFALLPASFGYAILRHRVLEAPLVQRWLVHGLLWGGLLAAYVGAIYALRLLPTAPLPAPGRTLTDAALYALCAAVIFGWVRDRLQRPLDRLIFKDTYDYRASLQGLSQDLSLPESLDTLGTAVPGTLRQLMNLDFAVLLAPDAQGPCPYGAGSYPPALLPELAEAARDVRDGPRVISLAYGYLNILVVPLHARDATVGHLCLGPKASGEPFRAEDYALLATLSGHLGAIVRNVQLVGDLSTKVDALDALNERLERAQEEARARISADLHDEPLQTALSLHHRLAAIGTPDPDGARAASIDLSRVLVAQLRALCTAMRPAALDDLGLHAALDQLTRDLGKGADVSISLDADPEVAELDLPPQVELVLYRATQEALNNCLRHADARTVRVSLQRYGDGVRLLVADDGAGFAVPARLESLALDEHHGLAGLSGRVRRIGGRLRVISAPGEGTTVRVDLLLSAMAAPT